MLIQVGGCEAEVRVAALMSCPRLGFTDNFFCVAQALAPHKISPIKITGAFWGQTLQRTMEMVMDTSDVMLVFDYDTIFTARTVAALLTLLLHSGVDAIAPLQTRREANSVMFCPVGHAPEDKLEVPQDWFNKPVQRVKTAHFGCTFLRTEALKKVPKPWFVEKANDKGDFSGGHIDADIGFWEGWHAAGNTLGIATQISVGHAELMITWPSRTAPAGKVQQHTTEVWSGDRTPPEGAWGFVK